LNYYTKKQARRISVFLLIFFCSCGGLLIYRSNLQIEDFHIVTGIPNHIELTPVISKSKSAFAIKISLENTTQQYGMYAGTKIQAQEKIENLDLKLNHPCKLYIDKTVLKGIEGIKLGIRQIEQENKLIFKETRKGSFIMGVILILFGILSSSILFLLKK
jgi:hypothetical protein